MTHIRLLVTSDRFIGLASTSLSASIPEEPLDLAPRFEPMPTLSTAHR